MQYGAICLAIGIGLFTIGGLIAIARNPRQLNDIGRSMFDPVRKGIPEDAQDTFNRTLLNDGKAKWLTRSGLALAAVGMVMLLCSAEGAKSSATTTPANIENDIRE